MSTTDAVGAVARVELVDGRLVFYDDSDAVIGVFEKADPLR